MRRQGGADLERTAARNISLLAQTDTGPKRRLDSVACSGHRLLRQIHYLVHNELRHQ